MKTSQWLTASILILGSCLSSAYASDTKQTDRGFYVGVDFGLYNATTLEDENYSLKEKSNFADFSYYLVAGYEFNTDEVIKLGLEAEYRTFSETNYSNLLYIKGHAFSVNIKPKFIVEYETTDVYVSLLAGLANMDIEATLGNSATSESKLGYNLGAELGVILNKNIDIHLGYRISNVDFESIEISTNSGYLGVRYFF